MWQKLRRRRFIDVSTKIINVSNSWLPNFKHPNTHSIIIGCYRVCDYTYCLHPRSTGRAVVPGRRLEARRRDRFTGESIVYRGPTQKLTSAALGPIHTPLFASTNRQREWIISFLSCAKWDLFWNRVEKESPARPENVVLRFMQLKTVVRANLLFYF